MKKMRESNELNMNPSIKWINSLLHLITIYLLTSLYGSLFYVEIEKMLNFKAFIITMIGIGLIFSFINYYKNKKEILEVLNKSLLCFFIMWLGIESRNFWLDKTIYIVRISGIVILIYWVLHFISSRRVSKSEIKTEPELYPSRRNLMEVLNHALREYSLIALDGTWGSGKTTFMKIFMRDNREKYYYIPINVMLFENRNSLKTEFLNQLKGIFKEEGIFQGSLMDFDYYLDGVSNDWVKVAKNIVFSKSKSFKEANEKLKSEIEKIEKKIVVGVDNLERIYGESEPEWKQILGFIHELQELGIKIVVMANLEEMLTIKKGNGEKDLSNHEYFDKFYEFKLKLNEVTTEEIIDKVEIKRDKVNESKIKENTVDREWLKNQIKELMDNLDKGFENLESKHLSGNKNEEEKKELEEKMLKYKELQNRYLENIVNPRKIEKLMKEIQTKKETIENIFNFIDNGDEHDKLIFKASMFSLVYFDYMNEIKEKDFNEFYRGNSFFEYLFYNIGESFRGLNRLLHYDSEENLVIDEIKKLILTKEINLSTIEKRLKDLEVYYTRLDPDFDHNTTKKAYKIIEKKLIELEETNENKIHEIIKVKESFICRMNYLSYPNEVGIYEKVDYKFGEKLIFKFYRESLESLERVGYPNDYYLKKTKNLEELAVLIERVCALTHQNDLTESELEKIKIGDIKKLKEKINNRNKSIYFYEKVEEIIFNRIINLLNILKFGEKNNKERDNNGKKIENLKNWELMDIKKKKKLLQNMEGNIEKKTDKIIDIEEYRDSLVQILNFESDESLILSLNELINNCNIYIFPRQIQEKILEIEKEENLEIQEKNKKQLVKFMNDKIKELRWQYIFNGSWSEYLNKLTEIGIKVDKNENGFNVRETNIKN